MCDEATKARTRAEATKERIRAEARDARIRDEAREARIRESFAVQPLMATLGARLSHVSAGSVAIALPFAAAVRQQHGFIHGGAIMAIADSAAGYAAMSTLEPGQEVLTIECKTNFLRPADGDLVATGAVVRAGRTMVTVTAEVALAASQKKVAITLATMAVVAGETLGRR
ncbi:MAG: PaaI family thioesterase [Pseudomonadota bacterium]